MPNSVTTNLADLQWYMNVNVVKNYLNHPPVSNLTFAFVFAQCKWRLISFRLELKNQFYKEVNPDKHLELVLCFCRNWVFPKCYHWIRGIQWQKYILYLKKIIRTCHVQCNQSGCYHKASKAQVAETIFKSNSCFTDLSYFPEFTEFLIHLGRTPMFALKLSEVAATLHCVVVCLPFSFPIRNPRICISKENFRCPSLSWNR